MSSNDCAVVLTDVPFPNVDFEVENPIPAILQSPEYHQAADAFGRYPFGTDPLISWLALALLYSTIRNQRPDQVVEIGSYKGSTAKVLAHALQANGRGTLHTIGPFDSHRFTPQFDQWPAEVKARTIFYPVSSMDFFIQAEAKDMRFDLVFVDGNHDYEFALFDILSAARRLKPQGFIFIDNISQAGPYFAAIDFAKQHPLWRRCDDTSSETSHLAFDRQRSQIPGLDFIILRAPRAYGLGSRPRTFGTVSWYSNEVRGVRLLLAHPDEEGTIWVQCVLRGFGATHLAEAVTTTSVSVSAGQNKVDAVFEQPVAIATGFTHYSVETWLTWTGKQVLQLIELPSCF